MGRNCGPVCGRFDIANEKSDLLFLLALGEGFLRHQYRDCTTNISPVFQDRNGANMGCGEGHV
jgi:hypothetical protein